MTRRIEDLRGLDGMRFEGQTSKGTRVKIVDLEGEIGKGKDPTIIGTAVLSTINSMKDGYYPLKSIMLARLPRRISNLLEAFSKPKKTPDSPHSTRISQRLPENGIVLAEEE